MTPSFFAGILVAQTLYCVVSATCHHAKDELVDVTWKNKGSREVNIALRGEEIRKKNSNYSTHTLPHFPGYKNTFGNVEWEKNVPVVTLHAYGEALLHVPKCGWTDWFREGDKGEVRSHWNPGPGTLLTFSDESPPRTEFKQS